MQQQLHLGCHDKNTDSYIAFDVYIKFKPAVGLLLTTVSSRVYMSILQATEADLWAVFSPVGEILELYVLRGPNGLSRGCGFITYANKFLAQQAIMSNNGKQMGSKVLVVKFADRSVPNKLM